MVNEMVGVQNGQFSKRINAIKVMVGHMTNIDIHAFA